MLCAEREQFFQFKEHEASQSGIVFLSLVRSFTLSKWYLVSVFHSLL